MMQIVEAKNHDYAGFDEDPFANFKVVENCGIASVEQGFLTRMMDKISRVNSFIKQGVCNVQDEKIEDTLVDLANYSILLSGYIKQKKQHGIPVPENVEKAQHYCHNCGSSGVTRIPGDVIPIFHCSDCDATGISLTSASSAKSAYERFQKRKNIDLVQPLNRYKEPAYIPTKCPVCGGTSIERYTGNDSDYPWLCSGCGEHL